MGCGSRGLSETEAGFLVASTEFRPGSLLQVARLAHGNLCPGRLAVRQLLPGTINHLVCSVQRPLGSLSRLLLEVAKTKGTPRALACTERQPKCRQTPLAGQRGLGPVLHLGSAAEQGSHSLIGALFDTGTGPLDEFTRTFHLRSNTLGIRLPPHDRDSGIGSHAGIHRRAGSQRELRGRVVPFGRVLEGYGAGQRHARPLIVGPRYHRPSLLDPPIGAADFLQYPARILS